MTIHCGHGHIDSLAAPRMLSLDFTPDNARRGVGDFDWRLLLDGDPEVLDAQRYVENPVLETVVSDLSGPDVVVDGVVAEQS